MDFENLVINKLDKIEAKQNKHDEKQDTIQSDVHVVKLEQAKQSAYIAQNTIDLTEHKEGVIQNRGRIEFLEKKTAPITVQHLAKRIVLWAGGIATIAGAAIALAKLFDL